MSNVPGAEGRLRITDRYLEQEGRPVIPVSGEMHFTRVPTHWWDERLRLMRSGGITAVATYLIWIHHEEERGRYRFDGNRDVRAFVEAAANVGLDVVLRIGPWAHGEVRNGGLPDWVQEADVRHRTDDPRYLALVEPWFTRLHEELDGLLGPDGPVVAIQIENELYDEPSHISTLRAMAERVGLVAPIYTATGWGSAVLPPDEVFPLFGGYSDGFWVDHDAPWDPTFRAHFFFSHVWDDPGIGADIRAHLGGTASAEVGSTDSGPFPPATCELGGGMARAYHRRPVVEGRDVSAMALTKLGNGSAWQGYYMYCGGTNPQGPIGCQESHATAYPNDMPRFDYDFNAPISATGRVRSSHGLLRRQHAFLRAFGAELGPMRSTLPDACPFGVEDATTLRWAVRSDGRSGFVLINRHQPIEPLPEIDPVRLELELEGATMAFPATPVAIPPGTTAIWPFDLRVGDLTVQWATATPLTVLPGAAPTLVLMAERGVTAQMALDAEIGADRLPGGASFADGVLSVAPGSTVTVEAGGTQVLVLSDADAQDAWVIDDGGSPRLVLAPDAVWARAEGGLAGRTSQAHADVRRYDTDAQRFVPVDIGVGSSLTVQDVPVDVLREAGSVPASYGEFQNRASAPTDEHIAARALRVRLNLPSVTAETELEVEWAGDVLRLLVDGVPVADQFWAGQQMVVDLTSVGAGPDSEVVLEVLPLHPEARVGLSAAAAARRAAEGSDQLVELTAVRVVGRARWNEV